MVEEALDSHALHIQKTDQFQNKLELSRFSIEAAFSKELIQFKGNSRASVNRHAIDNVLSYLESVL